MNHCTVSSVTTTQLPLSTRQEIVYTLHDGTGRFVMPREQCAEFLAELIACPFIARLSVDAGGPLVIAHCALDIEARDRVVSILARYCIDGDSLPLQLDRLSQSRPLPQVREAISQEGWLPDSGSASAEG